MSKRSRIKAGITVAVALLIAAIVVTVVYLRLPPVNPRAGNPLSSSEDQRYAEMVSAFYTGIAALDVDARDRARTSLTRATELYPEEPAAWADLGLLDLRTGDLDTAAREIERAKTLAPENGEIEGLLGHFAGLRGEYAEAVSHFRRATTLNPDDLRSRNSLIHEVERLGERSSDTEALALAGELVAKAPQNIVALLERARLAVKRGDREALSDSVARLGELAQSWPANARAVLPRLRAGDHGEVPDGRPPRSAASQRSLANTRIPQGPLRARNALGDGRRADHDVLEATAAATNAGAGRRGTLVCHQSRRAD